ncbi:Hypothetical protein SMAX5B_020046 [Scophthalmus maximus]|uniref:Uncharacterized protein n=1 Tax=Scophthalmus maximus TaxID=52904 RepID=A0A2U9CSE4_SCOMX|nr:Hypothetical protein SMAX5B_020046 [Scophthalmus maximus]
MWWGPRVSSEGPPCRHDVVGPPGRFVRPCPLLMLLLLDLRRQEPRPSPTRLPRLLLLHRLTPASWSCAAATASRTSAEVRGDVGFKRTRRTFLRQIEQQHGDATSSVGRCRFEPVEGAPSTGSSLRFLRRAARLYEVPPEETVSTVCRSPPPSELMWVTDRSARTC